MLNDRIIEFPEIKVNILIKIKRIQHNIKIMKYKKPGCDICEIDIHGTFSGRPLKSKSHLEKIQQKKVIVLRKNPKKWVLKDDIKVSDTEDKNLICFTGRILKIAYDINRDIHNDKNANSVLAITSKPINTGIVTLIRKW